MDPVLHETGAVSVMSDDPSRESLSGSYQIRQALANPGRSSCSICETGRGLPVAKKSYAAHLPWLDGAAIHVVKSLAVLNDPGG